LFDCDFSWGVSVCILRAVLQIPGQSQPCAGSSWTVAAKFLGHQRWRGAGAALASPQRPSLFKSDPNLISDLNSQTQSPPSHPVEHLHRAVVLATLARGHIPCCEGQPRSLAIVCQFWIITMRLFPPCRPRFGFLGVWVAGGMRGLHALLRGRARFSTAATGRWTTTG
jgi:hypothetical protein